MTRIPEISNEEKAARLMRVASIRALYDQGLLTKADAEELLNGNLTPDDPTTKREDGHLLEADVDTVYASLGIDPGIVHGFSAEEG